MSVPLATDRPLLAAMWADLANIQARFVEQQALFVDVGLRNRGLSLVYTPGIWGGRDWDAAGRA